MKKLIVIFLLLSACRLCFGQAGFAKLSGKMPFLKEGDTVELEVYKYGFFEGLPDFMDTYKAPVINGSFTFQVKTLNYPQEFSLMPSPHRPDKNLLGVFIETGDDIIINYEDNRYTFSGKGVELFNISRNLWYINYAFAQRYKYFDINYFHYNQMLADTETMAELRYLDSNKTKIRAMAYSLIKGYYLTADYDKNAALVRLTADSSKEVALTLSAGFRHDPQIIEQLAAFEKDTDLLAKTEAYTETLIANYTLDSCYEVHQAFCLTKAYKHFKNKYTGMLRDKLIAQLLYDNRTSTEGLMPLVSDALSYVSTSDFRQLLQKIREAQIAGSPAYDFELVDTQGRHRKFSEFKGKVVVLDFWYTGCPACAAMSPYLTKVEEAYERKNVVFISINIDKKQSTWLSSVARQTYTGPKTINLFTSGMGENNPVIKHYEINAFPTLMLINSKGLLAEYPIEPELDNGKGLKKSINELLGI